MIRSRTRRPPRPTSSFDTALQHERTALAWERTAIAMIVAGLVFSRYAAVESLWVFAGVGLAETAFGAALLVWTGVHYEALHGQLRHGNDVVHPVAVRLVGSLAVGAIGAALLMAVTVTIRR